MRKLFTVILGYGLTPHSLDTDEKQVRFYHLLNESFKFAYGKRSAMGDEYDSQTEKNQDIERVRNGNNILSSVRITGFCKQN